MYILFKQKDSLQNGKKCLCKLCDWSRDGLPKYPNDLHSSISKKPHKNPMKKQADLNRRTSEEYIQMASRNVKRCSTSQIIREEQTRTIARYHLTPIRTAIRKSTHSKCRRGCGEKGTLLPCWEWKLEKMLLRKTDATKENSIKVPSKTKAKSCQMAQQSHSSACIWKRRELVRKNLTLVCSQQHYLQQPRRGSTCTSTDRRRTKKMQCTRTRRDATQPQRTK